MGFLFEEPTSALDPEMIQAALNIMIELSHDDVTMAVVTHEGVPLQNPSLITASRLDGGPERAGHTSPQ